MPDLHLTVVNKLPDIRLAAGAVETFGRGHGLPERLMSRLGLALDEVLTNLVSYGFPMAGGMRSPSICGWPRGGSPCR